MDNFMQIMSEEGAIRNVQRYLRQISYFEPSIGNIIIDGIYREPTRNGVITFQRIKGISPTGIVDKETWDLLYGEYLLSLKRNSTANAIMPFYDIPGSYAPKIGDSNALVRLLELMLEEVSTEYVLLENSITHNGIFDTATSDALREYQRINMLPESGILDRDTWDRLADDYNLILRKNSAQ